MSAIEEISKAKYMSTSSISSASSSSSTTNQQPASSVGPSEGVELDKNSRVVWNEELHRKFLNAIHALLPNEKPVPKRIMELMGVKGLKRKPVTSHLQKYNLRVVKKDKDHSSKQMGFPSMRDGRLNLGNNYPRVWYPTFANILIPAANIPGDGNNSDKSKQKDVPEEPAVDVPEEGNATAAVEEEEKKEEDDDDGHVSTLLDNFWKQDPPALD